MSDRMTYLRFELTQIGLDLRQLMRNLNEGHVVEVVRYLDEATAKVEKLLEATKTWEG